MAGEATRRTRKCANLDVALREICAVALQQVGVAWQMVAAWQRLLEEKGVAGLKRGTLGRPRELSDAQCAELGKLLVQGALAQGFPTDLAATSWRSKKRV